MVINSAPYASFEERKNWVAEMAARIPRDVRVPYPLLAEVPLLEKEVLHLQGLALAFIAHSLSLPATMSNTEILERLNAGQFTPDRDAHHLLIPLERQISQMLRAMGFHESSLGLEYPANVRVVHGKSIEAYDKTSYPTTTVHSDVWAGEPADTVQIIVPLMGNVQSNICRWYEVDIERFELYLCNSSDYRSTLAGLEEVRPIPHTFEIGKLYFFDSALPHQTIQTGGGVRLSLDFRLRRLFPYSDRAWIPRMQRTRGAYDRYYLFPSDPYPYASFEQKLDHEIGILDNLGFAEFAHLRRNEYPAKSV